MPPKKAACRARSKSSETIPKLGKVDRAEATKDVPAAAVLASRDYTTHDLATDSPPSSTSDSESNDESPPTAPLENWKVMVGKLLRTLRVINRYYKKVNLQAVVTAMKPFQKTFTTVKAVRDAFNDAMAANDAYVQSADLHELTAKLPDAELLGIATLPLNIFTFNTVHAFPELFLKKEHTLVSDLQVLFLDNAPLGNHVKRVSHGSATIDMSVVRDIANVDASQVVVLHGESGSGKTLTAMLSASKHTTSRHAALCVCVTPEDVRLTKKGTYPRDPTLFKQQFMTQFQSALERMWNYLVSKNSALTGKATEGHVTVLFDEFGSESEAIRAICGSQDALTQKTRDVLLLDGAVTVQIIVAGAGAHGGTHLIGSQPDTYHLQTVAPAVWSMSRPTTATQGATPFAIEVCEAVERRGSRAANTAYRMVTTNARACAIFLHQLSLVKAKDKRLVSPKLLSDLVARTAAQFKSLNGLHGVSEKQYRDVYFRAVALSLYAPEENPWAENSADVSLCFRDCGMVTDRAIKVKLTDELEVSDELTVLQKRDDLDPKEANHVLCLPKEYNGQRFYLSEAQIVIAQTVLGLGDRGHSGDGFEDLVADLFMHAAVVAPLLKGKKLLRPIEPKPEKPLPQGWIHTLRLLARLIKSAGASTRVIRARLQDKIEPNTKGADRDEQVVRWSSDENVDAVLLNADKAAFADLIFKQMSSRATPTVWLVQTKRYESRVLSANATLSELAKMDPQSVHDIIRPIVGAACDTSNCKTKRVVFVWGETPAAVTTPPDDVLLVHAWDPDADALAKSPALGGLYPFNHKDADFSVVELPIRHPTSLQGSSAAASV